MNSLKSLRVSRLLRLSRVLSQNSLSLNKFSTNFGISDNQSLLKYNFQKDVFPRRFFSDLPPHQIIKLPNLSPTMETGNIVSWALSEGDEINEGDLLAEIETDKATMALDASESGFLAKILIQKGSEGIPVGTPLCVIVEDKSLISQFADYKPDSAEASSAPAAKKAAEPKPVAKAAAVQQPKTHAPVSASTPVSTSNMPFITPLARRLAEEQGIKIDSSAVGSGYMNSITSVDLARIAATSSQSALSQPSVSSSASFTDIPLSNMRSVIAKRLLESKTTIPHYYLTVDINMDEILLLRKTINEKLKKEDPNGSKKISVNDIIVKAASMACTKIPDCNSSFQGTFIRQFNQVDMCIAVATSNGLITPIIPSAQSKSFLEISNKTRELADKAKNNALKPHEFQGGTFTISNLGMFGIDHFSAIINPPQACILAVGNTVNRLVPDSTSERGFKESSYMSVTLCCDHRVVDGAVGAQWLKKFREMMEEPALMLM